MKTHEDAIHESSRFCMSTVLDDWKKVKYSDLEPLYITTATQLE